METIRFECRRRGFKSGVEMRVVPCHPRISTMAFVLLHFPLLPPLPFSRVPAAGTPIAPRFCFAHLNTHIARGMFKLGILRPRDRCIWSSLLEFEAGSSSRFEFVATTLR